MEEGRRGTGTAVMSNMIFVAVGKELANYRSTLRWVLENFWGKQICIIYVHVPSQIIPMPLGGKILASQLGEEDLAAFREREKLEMRETINSYVHTFENITTGNPIPKGISHSANSIHQGIVEVISQNRAGQLIMGAATDTGYSSGMSVPTSTKAIYVRQHAPKYCQLQFICWGKLICTREPSDVLRINELDTGPESSSSDSLSDQLEQAILRTGYSLRQQKAEIEDICQEYLAKKLCDLELKKDEALEEVEQLRKQLAEGLCDLKQERDEALEAEQLRKRLAERLRNLELERDEALVEAEQLSKQLAEGLCDLKLERDEAMEEAEQLRKQLDERLRELNLNEASEEAEKLRKQQAEILRDLKLERDKALEEAEQLRTQLAERLRELNRYEASEETEKLRKQQAELVCDLKLERDEALEEAEQLRKQLAERLRELNRYEASEEAEKLRKQQAELLCDLKLEKDEALEEAEQLRKQLAERLRELNRYEASEEAEKLRKQQAEILCDLKLERDEALEEAEQLRKQLAERLHELNRYEASEEAEKLRKQQAEILCDLKLERDEALEEADQLRKQLAERLRELNRYEASEEAEKLRKQQAEIPCDFKLERDEALEEARQLRKQLAEKLRELNRYEASEETEKLRKQQAEILRDLKLERDEALKEAKQLRKQLAKKRPTPLIRGLFSKFSTSDVKKATNNFDRWAIIGQGGFGNIYKGLLGQTEVAIKVLHLESQQGPLEFQREMDALSNLRHPNLVTLVGACVESRALIYQYLHGGNLEDRLNRKDNSLTWQTRIKIAIELCSVVAFLHYNAPNIIIHGDLKPANILLDENFVCKLSDFGICHISPRTGENLTTQNTSFFTTPRGTISYMDPEFLATGVLSKKSDVYSVGVILLRLLTGKPSLKIAKEVTKALESGTLESILDPLAGDWPSVQAKELTGMALLCCEMTKQNRPDITKLWRFLKLIKASWVGLSTHERVCDVEPPTHFLCPIFQEIMQDPHIAADGFTYEKDAIRGWLEIGGDMSPTTKVALQDSNIVPNHALKLAIQEWLLQNHTVQ